MSEGRKYDEGKAPLTRGCLRYFPKALAAIAQVSDYGRRKYKTTFEERNFLKVEDGAGRYLDAIGRHLSAVEEIDEESGCPHMAHAAWNILAYLELTLAEEVPEPMTVTNTLDRLRAGNSWNGMPIIPQPQREVRNSWDILRRKHPEILGDPDDDVIVPTNLYHPNLD